jgi:hypothetical protein
MQPLDRNNEAMRRSAAAMRAAALHQRTEAEAQCRRLRPMRVAANQMQARLRRFADPSQVVVPTHVVNG